ncbi:Cytochrome c oxidase subunit 6, mitochondrial [Verticillium dahliae]
MSAALLRVAARRGFFNANPVVRSAPLAARAAVLLPMAAGSASHFSTVPARRSEHQEETFEEFSARYAAFSPSSRRSIGQADDCTVAFSLLRLLGKGAFFSPSMPPADHRDSPSADHFSTARFEKEFDAVNDVFELQRNLNNAFAYDLVPSPTVVAAALKAARRVNDFATAVRVFEGVKAKVENKGQYEQYLAELKPLREELGLSLKEDIYPEQQQQ